MLQFCYNFFDFFKIINIIHKRSLINNKFLMNIVSLKKLKWVSTVLILIGIFD